MRATSCLDVAHRRRVLRFGARAQPHRGAGLVDHVDRLVGQEAVVEVRRRELDARARSAAAV